MPNPYYDHTTFPTTGSTASSASMRAELDLVEAGFDKLPTLSGNGLKTVRVNAGGTSLEAGVVLGDSAVRDVGTGAGDVAAGDHLHAQYYTSDDVGTTAGTIAAGDHSHAQYFTASDVGTGAGEIAAGDHTHSIYLTETNPVITGSITEEVYALSGTTPAISPADGTIQTWTLSGNSTPTAGTWAAGQGVTLMIDDGSAFEINWSTVAPVWKTNSGSAPTLNTSGFTVVQLWKVGSTIYGARVGDA